MTYAVKALLLVALFVSVRPMPQGIDYFDAIEVGLEGGEDKVEEEEEQDPRVICAMPMYKGLCRGLFVRWGYDPNTKSCKTFNYGGCSANANNFRTKKQCFRTCEGI